MTAFRGSVRFLLPYVNTRCRLTRLVLAVTLGACGITAAAQTTTISGTVYDPRTTASALPLSNVLVYVTTGTVPPLPGGAQCLTFSAPAGVTSYTYTAVDGTFMLSNVPVNSSYTLVIQAGKWRRQFPETVAGTALTGLSLHMPSTHLQGDIPLIAIATGAADGVECVLRNMGIADTEFTDDTGTTNPGGRIHLYQGSGNPGAYISTSTPVDTVLTGSEATLNQYDMVMFPCQGEEIAQSSSALTNITGYANGGGRVFTTHFSYVWLDPDLGSQFPAVANWDVNQGDYPAGVGTVNTGFSDGAALSQWLENAGADYNNTPGQVEISTLRHDLDSVIPPTQTWLTFNDSADGNPIMQLTFNTPVGAPAAQQCGRVLFNEYHVIDQSNAHVAYPGECSTGQAMTPQEEMLEYALFDLSTFVQPVTVPTLNVTFTPSPVSVKNGDTADQVTVNVANTSSSISIDSSATLTVAVPPQLTVTAMTDSTGGWICTVGTLTCTRKTSIPSSVSDDVTLTFSVSGGSATPGTITATVSSPTFSNNVTATDTVIFQQPPPITWATPAPIVYGTPLSATQLDASSSLAGTFTYSPAAGTVLAVGQHTLQVSFAPTDTVDYTTGTASVTLTVISAVPVVTVTPSGNPTFLSNSVTFTASVQSLASTPTGSVTFFDGATQIGTSSLAAGAGSFTTSTLALGTHAITAVYSGDSNYLAATSSPTSQLIEDFSIALQAGASAGPTVYPGTPAAYPLVLTPVGGSVMASNISLAASGLPFGATGSFSPASVNGGAGASVVTFDVKPLSVSRLGARPSLFGRGSLPMALGLILLPFAGRMRKMRSRLARLTLWALAAAGLTMGTMGCGSTTYTPVTSTLTVTATAGSLSHSTTVNITVE